MKIKYYKYFDYKLIGITLIVTLLIRMFLFYIITVPTDSMQPTISNNAHYLVSKVFKKLNRGDIVVFTHEGDSIKYVKRIVGLPGEKLKLEKGTLYIDGVEIKEDYIKYPGGIEDFEVIIPKNEYVLLGDNRADSKDSRYWDKPTLSIDDIEGKVLFVK